MGNKQNNLKAVAQQNNNQQAPVNNKQNPQIKKQQKKGQSTWGCFGGKRQSNRQQAKPSKSARSGIGSKRQLQASKSQIIVDKVPNAKIDQKLFQDREKQLINIRLIRNQKHQILKDQDYFDSQKDDKNDLNHLTTHYDTCQIANYQTPQLEKLQTVRVKTYLFDRNVKKANLIAQAQQQIQY